MDEVPASKDRSTAGRGPLRPVLATILLLSGAIGLISGADRTQAPPVSGQQFNRAGTPSTRPTLKIGTYNIRGGRGMDDRVDLSRTAEVMKDIDVVGLNEVHGHFNSNDADELGRLLNRPSLFAPSERRWWSDYFGNGMLCALPVEGWLRIPLVGTQGAGHRCVLLTRVKWNDKIISVLVTHLDRTDDREKQLDAVLALFESLQPPAVLMGDLNTRPNDAKLQTLLASGATDALRKGLKGKDPGERIEWIFTRGLTVLDAGMVDHGASDHPFVWVEVK